MCDFECGNRPGERRLSSFFRRRLHSTVGFFGDACSACSAWIFLIGWILQAAFGTKPENQKRGHCSPPSDERGLAALARTAMVTEIAEGIRRSAAVQIA